MMEASVRKRSHISSIELLLHLLISSEQNFHVMKTLAEPVPCRSGNTEWISKPYSFGTNGLRHFAEFIKIRVDQQQIELATM